MKRRHAWLGAAGMTSLWLAGCVFQQGAVRPPKTTDSVVSANPEMAKLDASPPEGPPMPPPPAPPSDYHPRDQAIRPAGYVEPTAAEAKADLAKPATQRKIPPPEEVPTATPAPDAPLVAALRCALEKHPDEARGLLNKYAKNDRELLLALVRLTANLGEADTEKMSPEDVSRTLEQLSAVTSGLRQKAPLTLDKVCFCKKIQGFGRYTPCAEQNEFQAGSDGKPGERVQVYAEVRNFASKPAEGNFETVLESRLEIRDAERNEIANIDLGQCVDRSQTPRQDYFLNFQLHVPPKMAPGLYTLWLKVKDVTSDPPRETSCSLDFKVRAAGDEAP